MVISLVHVLNGIKFAKTEVCVSAMETTQVEFKQLVDRIPTQGGHREKQAFHTKRQRKGMGI